MPWFVLLLHLIAGDKVYSGTVVKRGEQDFIVTETGEHAEIGKGVALIQSVESKGQVSFLVTFLIPGRDHHESYHPLPFGLRHLH